jgi:hypothetical protein
VFDQTRANRHRRFLRKILGANPLGYLKWHSVGRHAYVNALAPRVFDDSLVVELQLFR